MLFRKIPTSKRDNYVYRFNDGESGHQYLREAACGDDGSGKFPAAFDDRILTKSNHRVIVMME